MRTRHAGFLAATATVALLLARRDRSSADTGDPEVDAVLDEASSPDAEEATTGHLFRPVEDVDVEPVADSIVHLPNGELAFVGRGVAAEALSDTVLNPQTFRAPRASPFASSFTSSSSPARMP